MDIADLLLKAKVNMALALDPRVSVLDIGVRADRGTVMLEGDVDHPEEVEAAGEIARRVEGVSAVRNELTCGVGKGEETVELVVQSLLDRLEEAWNNLPDQSAMTQADYLRWAFWLVYKFRLPEHLRDDVGAGREAEAVDEALTQVAGYVGTPKAMLALWMLQQAESVEASRERNAPDTAGAQLVATPMAPEREEVAP